MICLPPKRFQDPYDSKFDAIAGKPWYPKLLVRRAQLPMLREAFNSLKTEDNSTQASVSAWYGIDERELRDYIAFTYGKQQAVSATFQRILNEAYEMYGADRADHHIRYWIEDVAPRWGYNARHVTEQWEINKSFYPTGYNLTV